MPLTVIPSPRVRFKHCAHWVVPVLCVLAMAGFIGRTPSALASERAVQHHHIELTIVPETHELLVLDTITVNPHDWRSIEKPLRIPLNRHLTVEEVHLGTKPTPFRVVDPSHDPNQGPTHTRIIEISELQNLHSTSPVDLTFRYSGKIHDPPSPSKNLRFVRPDKTNGHIGPEGVYLTSETFWYPAVPGMLCTFIVQVTLPQGWIAVSQGHQISQHADRDTVTATWEVKSVSEALTLVANQFVKHHRDWNGIEVATYLFQEDAALAEQYLTATAQYLEVYTTVLGPYPFRKFAVVENFFPSGLGLPSYTLLGSRVIKRGYTQPYSLGHEIVHSWFGNSIFNHFENGNWVEGLTTYLANYYYDELTGLRENALNTRRRMFFEYSLYADPAKDFPLIQFHHKETQIDNAVGYQKAAMVFHMLRRELGDQTFFSAIRTLVSKWSGAFADWGDLEQVFEETSKRELDWFFKQWVEQPGAPIVKILHAKVTKETNANDGAIIDLTLIQQTSPYRIRLPLFIDLVNGQTFETTVTLTATKQTVSVPVPSQPIRLTLDPQFEAFRRLLRDQVPPMLNVWVTDENRVLVLPRESSPEELAVYRPILDRLHAQNKTVVQRTDHDMTAIQNSMLVLDASPGNRLTSAAVEHCPQPLALEPQKLKIQEHILEGSKIAWLISCPHPTHPGRTITVFSGFSPEAISRVARLLFFYGWDSYLVFNDGQVVARGILTADVTDLEIVLKAD